MDRHITQQEVNQLFISYQLCEQGIKQIEKTIINIEPLVDLETFKEYCDNAYSCIATLKTTQKTLKNDTKTS